MSNKTWLTVSVLAAAIGAGIWWNRTPPAGDAAAGAASAGASGAANGAASGAGAPRLQAVGVFAARRQDVPVQIEVSGTVSPLKSVDIRAQITGTVQDVLISDGQDVKAGQPLFRFDDRAERANLEKAKAQLVRDRATQADLERQLRRARELREQNFIAQSAVDTVQAQVDAQLAVIAADTAAQKSTEVSLSYSTVRAPLSGRTGLVSISPGSLVQPAAAALPLVTISQMDPIGVTFSVPETQLAALQQAAGGRGRPGAGPGGAAPAGKAASAAMGAAPLVDSPKKPPLVAGAASAAMRPPGAASGPAAGASGAGGRAGGLRAFVTLPGGPRNAAEAPAPLEGRVSFIDNTVDATTGTIKVRAEFPNGERQLWPGQYVRVKLTLRTVKDAVVIPQAALIIRGQERSVYVVGDDNTAQLRTVQTRQPQGEMIVVEGIQAGEKVVLDGKQNLRPGNPVKAVPAQLDPAGGGRRRGPADAASGAAASASGAVAVATSGAAAGGSATAASGARP